MLDAGVVSIHFVSCHLILLGYADVPLLLCVIYVEVISAVFSGDSIGAVWEPYKEPLMRRSFGFRLDFWMMRFRWPVRRLIGFKKSASREVGVVFVEIIVFPVIVVFAHQAEVALVGMPSIQPALGRRKSVRLI